MEQLQNIISQISEPWVLYMLNILLEGCRILFSPLVYEKLREYDRDMKKEGHYDQFMFMLISTVFTIVFYVISVFASIQTTNVILTVLMGIQGIYLIYLVKKVVQLVIHFAQRKQAIDLLIEKEKEGKDNE